MAAIYWKGRVKEQEDGNLTKEERVSLCRFRTDHSLELQQYRARTGLSKDTTCRICAGEPETTEYIICNCPGTLQGRVGEGIEEMADLVERPRQAWKIWNWFLKKGMYLVR